MKIKCSLCKENIISEHITVKCPKCPAKWHPLCLYKICKKAKKCPECKVGTFKGYTEAFELEHLNPAVSELIHADVETKQATNSAKTLVTTLVKEVASQETDLAVVLSKYHKMNNALKIKKVALTSAKENFKAVKTKLATREHKLEEFGKVCATLFVKKPTCVVCWNAEPNHVCMPCGHAYFCETCVDKLNRCPACQAIVVYKKKIFLQ